MNYGVPYKGGKNKIAEWVIAHLPAADTLVDLFAGGCGITHCALLSGKFRRIIANDIADTPKLFLDAAQGKYPKKCAVSAKARVCCTHCPALSTNLFSIISGNFMNPCICRGFYVILASPIEII